MHGREGIRYTITGPPTHKHNCYSDSRLSSWPIIYCSKAVISLKIRPKQPPGDRRYPDSVETGQMIHADLGEVVTCYVVVVRVKIKSRIMDLEGDNPSTKGNFY